MHACGQMWLPPRDAEPERLEDGDSAVPKETKQVLTRAKSGDVKAEPAAAAGSDGHVALTAACSNNLQRVEETPPSCG